MGLDLTVVVSTFGDPKWHMLAELRALPSARALDVPIVHSHADGLADARNRGLAEVDTEHVCFLDADDELEDGYREAMERSSADVRAPSVRYVRGSRWQEPAMPRVSGHSHACRAECLVDGNWLVVGSVVRTELIRGIGGWLDEPMYEDWSVWLRCHLAGASFEAVPQAVYRAHVRADSRNRAPSQAAKYAAHKAIAEANGIGMPV